jgi:hypothetical protein
MKTLLMLLALLFLPVLCLAQNGTMQQSGNMTFHNFNGTIGTSLQFGNMQSNHFNNGQSATRRPTERTPHVRILEACSSILFSGVLTQPTAPPRNSAIRRLAIAGSHYRADV